MCMAAYNIKDKGDRNEVAGNSTYFKHEMGFENSLVKLDFRVSEMQGRTKTNDDEGIMVGHGDLQFPPALATLASGQG